MTLALALRHIHFEDLGVLDALLRERGFEVRTVDATVADLDAIDAIDVVTPGLVVVLGGPIGVGDTHTYPFLAAELALIERRLTTGGALLGICLGAQLIAHALGAAVEPMGHKEIGYAPLTLTADGATSVLAPLAGQAVLHWHGDRFTVPAGGRLLASTARCEEQAFAVGDTVLGLQFHLEADPACIERWLVGHACELAQAGIDPRTIRDGARRHGDALAAAARRAIGDWLDRSCPNEPAAASNGR